VPTAEPSSPTTRPAPAPSNESSIASARIGSRIWRGVAPSTPRGGWRKAGATTPLDRSGPGVGHHLLHRSPCHRPGHHAHRLAATRPGERTGRRHEQENRSPFSGHGMDSGIYRDGTNGRYIFSWTADTGGIPPRQAAFPRGPGCRWRNTSRRPPSHGHQRPPTIAGARKNHRLFGELRCQKDVTKSKYPPAKPGALVL